jgi:hypothetical protein
MEHPAPQRLPLSALFWPALAVSLLTAAVLYAVAVGGGQLAAVTDAGGAAHELFHDARHLLGVPCH